jgi:predicted glycoside hydrolase/deacetylase ChbG (UPF0249 family)
VRPSGALLIVNADDYGLTEAVSRGVLRAHREGICTSTSILVLAPAFARSAAWLHDEPSLGVGVHLALVGEDPPLLSAREVPTLVDRRGRLATSWRQLLPKIAARRVDSADIDRELAAQIDAVRDTGLRIDHLDSHQHVHMFPGVREITLDLAQRFQIPAVRVTHSAAQGPVGVVVRRLAARLHHDASARGLVAPADAAGLDEAGRLDTDRAIGALSRLAARGAATVELSSHPGEAIDTARGRYDWDYRWGDELAALCAPEVKEAVARHGFRLGTYRDLIPGAP